MYLPNNLLLSPTPLKEKRKKGRKKEEGEKEKRRTEGEEVKEEKT